MKFSELNLEPSLSAAIQKLNYDDCTPIQEQSIPPLLDGKDVAGLAQTGTGKTAAFVIPLMERILRARPLPDDTPEDVKTLATQRAFPDWKPQNFILILVPTRELAEQVQENIAKLSIESGLRGFAIYGGTGYDRQKEALKNSVEFIVATPGRLIDLYKEHLVDLKQVRAIVFDEADRMFDMGFKDDMKFILQRVPQDRQFLVFSATLNFEVLNTAYQFGSEPVEVNISRDQTKAENVKDQIFHVGSNEKPQQLLSLLKTHNAKQAIVFTNFKMNVDKISKFLVENGIPAMAISSLLTQAQRNRVIEQFKAENDMNILVATDVAARGLDIKGVDLVINYELPMDSESYVHRIGRTGRAGTLGQAFSLVGDKDIESLSRIEDYLKHKIDVGYLENDQLIKDFKPMPYGDGYQSRSFDKGPRPQRSGGDSRPPRRDHKGASATSKGPREPQRPASRPTPTPIPPGTPPRQHKKFEAKPQQNRGDAPSANRNRPQPSKKGRPQPSKRRTPMVAQKSLGQKISGFFKRLFS